MRFEIITIFPGFFAGIFEHGIVRRAQAQGLVTIALHDLRNFTHDRHRTVDDRPFGGGEGMVLKPEPLAEALESLGISPKLPAVVPQGVRLGDLGKAAVTAGPAFRRANNAEASAPGGSSSEQPASRTILLSAQGRPFKQSVARQLAALERLVLICGRYEGIDERVNELYCDMELSVGDYVLSGGELAAAVVVDAVMRLVPDVLGNEASGAFESFGEPDAEIPTDESGIPRSQHGSGGLLDYPHYTRPTQFAGLCVPEVLLNGDHQQIRRWRREQQLRKTLANRSDLLDRAALTADDEKLLRSLGWRGD